MQIAEPLQIAIDELSKLPTVGRKTAQRLAMHLLKSNTKDVENLVRAIGDLKTKLRFCRICFNLSVDEVCEVCKNPKRDHSTICVVEDINDVMAIEKTNEYNGLYHILGGVLSPLSGTGVESLKIKELMQRLENEKIKEVILALNPDTEGETTSLYIAKLIKPMEIKVSRIARGIPVGGDLEFTDEATIGRAVLGRIII
ncbi:MAG: recombination mediator RecR [Bacteroidota bacterium]|nr:recombination mediator RecR [Bacteroidota bacterium]MDP4192212.1 recombination mediator RecR [Bacteroidota bacterium]MDP4195484.1 recombination mediator RecR [Bacteroidota bacterium]